MNLPATLFFGLICLLAGVSASPNENDTSLLRSIAETLQNNPAPDVAPSIAAPIPMTQDRSMVEPEPGVSYAEMAKKEKQQRLTDGLVTIAQGAMELDLEKMLRGTFSIATKPIMRDRATLVLDAIFGNNTGTKP